MSNRFHCLEDFRKKSLSRLPRLMFDFIDGAAGSEYAACKNIETLDRIRLLPRVLVNVAERSLKKKFLGKEWGLPFGIAPMGMCDLAWPGTDKALAKASLQHNIPLCHSIASSSSLEVTFDRAGVNAWFQLYVGASLEKALEHVKRAHNTGYEVLILTVDVPQVAQRIRDLRNGFNVPFRIGARQFLDFAKHPSWVLETLLAGVPKTANFDNTNLVASYGNTSNAFIREETRGKVDWKFLQQLRKSWMGKLIVKGVLAPQDAVRIKEAGADAIYVSNHGGRQLDSAPPAVSRLPLIREALGNDYPLLFDSGIRNGESVVKALALGADFVMLGRPFLFASGAYKERGVMRLIELLSDEVSLTLAQLGCISVEELDPKMIIEN